MRVRIIGGTGSGKTTFANLISEVIGIKIYQLDDIRYIKKYSEKRDVKDREKILNKIAIKKNWIIEGTQTSNWTKKSVQNAEIVIILKISVIKQFFRLTKRYLFNKLSRNNPDTIRDLIDLYLYAYQYENPKFHYVHKKNKLLKNTKAKIVFIHNNKEITEFVNCLKKKKRTILNS